MSQPAAFRLDALTSLRFFAAMMIVLLHTQEGFGFGPSAFNLQQGVSFFYVLSGFILTLVYPRLSGWAAVRAFWRARFARVWPGYVLALFAGAWLVGYRWQPDTAAAYLAMVQSWIPLPRYFFAYNPVGWSVATEWFFYLAFPLLVLDFERTWKRKLALSLALVALLVALCQAIPMSTSQEVWQGREQWVPNQNGLMYIHPLARLFEFVLGMCVALAWRRRGAPRPRSLAAATALELAVLALCAGSMLLSIATREWAEATWGFAIWRWQFACGSAPAFAALVYVVACGEGWVARALAWRPLVVGGEISYSIYLLHGLLFLAYQARAWPAAPPSGAVAYATYIGVVWLASYVAWRCVEMPARRLIAGGQLHGSSVVTQATRAARLGHRLRPALALAALGGVALAVHAATSGPALLVRAPGQETPRRHSPRSCHLESADEQPFARGEPMVANNATVQLRGWFLSEISGRPGLAASLRLLPDAGGPGWQAPIQHWIPRPDVLAAMQATGRGDVGFVQRFELSALAPGTYRLQLLFDDGGKPYDCNTGQRLVVDGR